MKAVKANKEYVVTEENKAFMLNRGLTLLMRLETLWLMEPEKPYLMMTI